MPDKKPVVPLRKRHMELHTWRIITQPGKFPHVLAILIMSARILKHRSLNFAGWGRKPELQIFS